MSLRPIAPARAKPTIPGLSRAGRSRAYAAASVVSLMFAGLGYRAYGLQVRDADKYREMAARQHLRTVEIPAPRGEILDSHGRALAVSADADSVFANPGEVRDVTTTAERLAAILGVDELLLEDRLGSAKHFTWLARHVTVAQATAVRALKLPGIQITKEPKRWYPGGASGGPVIGDSNVDGQGVDGVELRMNDLLTGERARFAAVRDARGHTMMADGLVDATPGATVTLTIDRTIQGIADQAVAEAAIANKATSGTAVVLEIGTGKVLAIANWPTFDPNAPAPEAKAKARDRAVTDAFEIGSTMKVFTIAAGLEAGVTRPDETWDTENGSWQWKGRHAITDDYPAPELTTTTEILKRSSNIGAAKLAMRLGSARLYASLKQFGFGARTGIELPGEAAGRVRDGATWRDSELATMAFGYGLTVTPLQLAAGIAAIGNDGVYVPPHVIASVTDASGATVPQLPGATRRMLSSKTAAQLRAAMMATVYDGGKLAGTAHTAPVQGFVCGGKTGTAYKYDHELKGYSKTRYVSSFEGLAPIDHPRVAIVVVIDDPSGGEHFGAKVAAPAFARMASEILRYLGVPGQKVDPDPPATADAKPVAKAKAAPPAKPNNDDDGVGDPGDLGLGDAPADAPPEIDALVVPDFSGMSAARALETARTAGLRVDLIGSGRARTQDVAPGPAPAGTVVRVTFADDRGRVPAEAPETAAAALP